MSTPDKNVHPNKNVFLGQKCIPRTKMYISDKNVNSGQKYITRTKMSTPDKNIYAINVRVRQFVYYSSIYGF
jgi:hypothetical protein